MTALQKDYHSKLQFTVKTQETIVTRTSRLGMVWLGQTVVTDRYPSLHQSRCQYEHDVYIRRALVTHTYNNTVCKHTQPSFTRYHEPMPGRLVVC